VRQYRLLLIANVSAFGKVNLFPLKAQSQ